MKNSKKLKPYKNIKVENLDIPKVKGKFDKIIITAGCPFKPKLLLKKLNMGGILIAPVGNLHSQSLIKIRKTKEGFKEENLGSFIFVPLRGEFGY